MHSNELNRRLKQIYKYYNVVFINNDTTVDTNYMLMTYYNNDNSWYTFNDIKFDLQNSIISVLSVLKGSAENTFTSSNVATLSSTEINIQNTQAINIYCNNVSAWSVDNPSNVATKHYIDFMYNKSSSTIYSESLSVIDTRLGHFVDGKNNIENLKHDTPGVVISIARWSGSEDAPGKLSYDFLGQKVDRYIAGHAYDGGQYHFASSSFIITSSNSLSDNINSSETSDVFGQFIMIRSQYITKHTTNS